MFSVDAGTRSDYYKYLARLNFEAAKAADDKIGFLLAYNVAAPPPVMTLCAHSIELSLKAYLLDAGLTEKSVRGFSHNLVRCWQACREHPHSSLPDINERTLEIMGDLLVSGRLRYGDESKLGAVPVFGPLSELCEQLLEMCGAPTWYDLNAHSGR